MKNTKQMRSKNRKTYKKANGPKRTNKVRKHKGGGATDRFLAKYSDYFGPKEGEEEFKREQREFIRSDYANELAESSSANQEYILDQHRANEQKRIEMLSDPYERVRYWISGKGLGGPTKPLIKWTKGYNEDEWERYENDLRILNEMKTKQRESANSLFGKAYNYLFPPKQPDTSALPYVRRPLARVMSR